MNSLLKLVLLPIIALFAVGAAGCGDDSPTGPTSENGYVVNGEGYSNVDVTATSSNAVVLSSPLITLAGGTLGGEPATLLIVTDAAVTREYTWTGNQLVGVTLRVGSGSNVKTWVGTTGKTVLSSVGSSGGRITGTFTGKLQLQSDDTKKIDINGRFNAIVD